VFGAFLDLYVINIPAAIFDLSKHSFGLTPEGSIVLLSTSQENNTNPTSGGSDSPTTNVEGLPSDLRTADIYDLKQTRTRLNSRSNYHYKKLIYMLDTNSAYNDEFNKSVKTLLAYQQDKVKIEMELDEREPQKNTNARKSYNNKISSLLNEIIEKKKRKKNHKKNLFFIFLLLVFTFFTFLSILFVFSSLVK
jgi:hypothetical protein